jgi:hypothetical protein
VTYANGTERAWWRYADRLEAVLRQRGFPGAIVGVSEGTDWNEPGTPRHGLDYWFLVAHTLDGAAGERLTALLGPWAVLGGGASDYDDWEDGRHWIADVCAGWDAARVRRMLRRVEKL